MKKIIIFFVIIATIVGITIFYLLNFVFTKEKVLIDVMNSKRTFIDEQSNEVLFKDYKIATAGTTTALKYTFVDLDGDEVDELAVYTTSDYGAYMIFRYDNQNKKVYGYMIGIRAFEELKTDGSFMGSNGAASNAYFTMSFDKNTKILKTEAKYDQLTGIYEINEIAVSEEEINKYVKEWNKKEKCVWLTDEITTIEKQDEIETGQEEKNNIDDYVGIYHNDNWNGREATLRLNKDGTAKYAVTYSGNICTWTKNDDVIIFRITDGETQNVREYTAYIVNGGLILSDHYFKKMN